MSLLPDPFTKVASFAHDEAHRLLENVLSLAPKTSLRCSAPFPTFSYQYVPTPVGPLLAISDHESLHMLALTHTPALAKDIENMQKIHNALFVSQCAPPLLSITQELEHYFKGDLHVFRTPVCVQGTAFQHKAWHTLQTIPYGTKIAYHTQAHKMGHAKSVRAAANANGRNRLMIIVPCHRVIKQCGKLGGYAGGLTAKQWLLNHEAMHAPNISA